MEDVEGHTRLTVNDAEVTVAIDPATPLIHILREDLGLTGVRTGCAIGECGACTVLVDGTPTRSCLTPLSEVTGRTVVTPEGLGTPDAPHPIQQVFLDGQAAQCGYCINGMIMTIAGLPRDGMSRAGVREALEEHICRCGAHVRILQAACRALDLDDRATGAGASMVPSDTPADGPATPADRALPASMRALPASMRARRNQPVAGREGPAALPPAIESHPLVQQWLEVDAQGQVVALAGKVELGQGIRTAFAQIVASQIGLPIEQVRVAATRTDRSPDQWLTAGSESIEVGGTALAYAARAFRRLLLARAATRLGCGVEAVELQGGAAAVPDGPRVALLDLMAERPITGLIEPGDEPRWDAPGIGESVARSDLRHKVTGAPAYLQDRSMPGLLHARIALPPSPDARLTAVELGGARRLPGVVEIVHDGRIVIVITERPDQAQRAVERIGQDLRWDEVPLDVPADLEAAFRSAPSEPFTVRQDDGIDDVLGAARRHAATYATPYQAHGPMAPSVAIARADVGSIRLWAHVQGVYPLRRELSALFGVDPDTLVVEHVDGPGCYGMNGADDAAAFAVMAARAVPGRPVRFQLSIQDEFGWEPYGSAMFADLSAGVDAAGRLVAWRHRALTDTHMARPGPGDRLLVAYLRQEGIPRPWQGAGEGGARNARPIYDVAVQDVVAHHVRGPLRTAALRCLGAYPNTFAAESFMDEMAELAGQDPVAFRLAHLTDDRARAVLELAAERAGWSPRVGPSGRGMGVALAHYKHSRAYVAQIAEVQVDREGGKFRVTRIVAACDAGTVVNPDGLRNQVEGGTLQGLSRALRERLDLGPQGVRQRDWTTYQTLRFSDVPQVDVHLVEGRDHPPLGVAESASPPVPAAVANAIDDAIGIRLRTLPLTAAQMQSRLLEMDEDESSRVLL